MPEIPEAAIEAVVVPTFEAAWGYDPDTPTLERISQLRDVERALFFNTARAALEAAIPHIREMIAEEIRAERNQASRPELADRYGGYYRGLISGLDLAAKIVRGDVK